MVSSSLSPVPPGGALQESWRALSQLKQIIQENMPITRHLQFSLFLNPDENLVATAPLGPNVNHQQTAFGGSLSMLATLAGWAMTRLILREQDCAAEVVIQKSSIAYQAPVCNDLVLTCNRPSLQDRSSFFCMLERWGKARLPLRCFIEEKAESVVVFEGSYAALAR